MTKDLNIFKKLADGAFTELLNQVVTGDLTVLVMDELHSNLNVTATPNGDGTFKLGVDVNHNG